jgi:predicted dehydrogenase
MWGKPTPGGKKDVDDYALALIRFEGGQTLNLNVSWALNVAFMEPDSGVRLMGDRGGVELKGPEPYAYGEEAGHLSDTKLHFTQNNPGLDEIAHFAECVKDGREPMPTAQQGRTIQSILDAIYRSSAEGKEVRVE